MPNISNSKSNHSYVSSYVCPYVLYQKFNGQRNNSPMFLKSPKKVKLFNSTPIINYSRSNHSLNYTFNSGRKNKSNIVGLYQIVYVVVSKIIFF